MSQESIDHTRITEEELVALLGPAPIQMPPDFSVEKKQLTNSGTDAWFKYRMIFLLAVTVMYTAKLFFFSTLAAANFDISTSDVELKKYFQYRAVFVIVVSAVYLYSYLKDWQFERVSLVFLGVGVTALVMDYFNTYAYLSQTPAPWIAGLIALRFLAIFCLLMNAMSARHAPPMPRRLWS